MSVEEVWVQKETEFTPPKGYKLIHLYTVEPVGWKSKQLLESVEQVLVSVMQSEVLTLAKGLADLTRKKVYVIIRKPLGKWSYRVRGRKPTSPLTRFKFGIYPLPALETVYLAYYPSRTADDYVERMKIVICSELERRLKHYQDVVEVYR